jgi:hypothetical protein
LWGRLPRNNACAFGKGLCYTATHHTFGPTKKPHNVREPVVLFPTLEWLGHYPSYIHACCQTSTVRMQRFYGQSSSVLHPALARALSSNVYRNLRALSGLLRSVCSTESGTITTRRKFLRATGSCRSSTLEPSARFLSSKGFDVGCPGGGFLNEPVITH